jgi:NAD-dependent dihydropyrimidine dehydrogenase PreA subunit
MTTTKTTRKIVHIDEDKCNGCGQCVPNCAEGAIEIVDGKARLVAENLCDGIGNCLGTCPLDAITIEERPAEEFDEQAVEQRLEAIKDEPAPKMPAPSAKGGCPGAMFSKLGGGCPGKAPRKLQPDAPAGGPTGGASRLGQWPVQLTLLPEAGEMWNGADVLIAADCVAFAMGNFHDELLAGKTLAIACPKLDDTEPYIQKLARIFAGNDIASLKVARMEVPCCTGLVHIVQQALELAGSDLKLREVVVGLGGEIKQR